MSNVSSTWQDFLSWLSASGDPRRAEVADTINHFVDLRGCETRQDYADALLEMYGIAPDDHRGERALSLSWIVFLDSVKAYLDQYHTEKEGGEKGMQPVYSASEPTAQDVQAYREKAEALGVKLSEYLLMLLLDSVDEIRRNTDPVFR